MLALLALLFIGFGFAAWQIVIRIADRVGKPKAIPAGTASLDTNKQNKRYFTGGKIMGNNGWLKLAIFSFVGILVSAAALGLISSGNPQQAMYQNGMQGMNTMPAMYGNANMQNGMNMGVQGMQNGMNMGVQGMQNGMNMGMQGMQSGMNMGMQGMQGGMDSSHMMLAQQMQMIQQQVFQLQQQMQMMQGGSGSMSAMPQSSSSGMGMGMMSNMPMGMGGMSSMPAGGSMSNMPSGGAAPAAAPMAPMPMM